MPKLQKMPVIVDGVRTYKLSLDDDPFLFSHDEDWIGEAVSCGVVTAHEIGDHWVWMIRTPEGKMMASPGDWILRGVEGEVYPCSDSIIGKTYRLIENEVTQ